MPEPIMKVEVVTPEEHLGDAIGDLNSRRGQINSFGDKPSGLKENLHKAHSDAITSGNDENTANDTALEEVFSRITVLKSHGARGSKRKTTSSKFSVGPTQEQFDAMKKRLDDRLTESEDKQIESNSKVVYLTGALTIAMSALQGHGLLDASIITQSEGGTSEPYDDVSMD